MLVAQENEKFGRMQNSGVVGIQRLANVRATILRFQLANGENGGRILIGNHVHTETSVLSPINQLLPK